MSHVVIVMKEKQIQFLIKILMFFGVVLVTIGVGLIVFSQIDGTSNGIYLIASLIAIGMFIALPTKLYMLFQTLKKKDEENNISKPSPKPQ